MMRLMLLFVVGLTTTALGGEKRQTVLFNHENLSGWEAYLVDPNVAMEDVWSVKDGLLVCKGEPLGYLATKKTYKNFKLTVEWRWPPGKEPGNSGVLMRITGRPMGLPRCVEAQLKNGDAGDIWAFRGFQVQGDSARFKKVEHKTLGKFQGVRKIRAAEKKPGLWNKYEITVKQDKMTIVINGEKVNECTGLDPVAGKIGLQSEGGEIHFRTVILTPLGD